MKLINTIGLFTVISLCMGINIYFVNKINEEPFNPTYEYYTFLADSKRYAENKKYPVLLLDNFYLTKIKVDGRTLIHYLEAPKSYHPGEDSGPSKKVIVDAMKEALKLTFCNKSYFQKLPLSVEFRFSVEENNKNPYDFVILSVESQEICSA